MVTARQPETAEAGIVREALAGHRGRFGKDSAAAKELVSFGESKPDTELAWKELDPWPGPRRILPVAAAQSDGVNECFFLFSGRNPILGQPTELLTDAYKYDSKKKIWT